MINALFSQGFLFVMFFYNGKKNWTGTAKTFILLKKKEVANENTFSGVILLALSVLRCNRSQVDPA